MAYSLGADYSKWQDDNSTPQQVDFAKAKRSGLSWVAIKTSQATWRDEDHAYNWRTAKAAGLLRAAYHFLVWDVQPTEQARFFFGLLKDDRPELDFVCDFEWWSSVPTNAITKADEFCSEVEQLSGKPCGLYTAPGFWKQYGSQDPKWARRPLWVANWGVTTPVVPAPWKTWTYWQYTNKGNGLLYGAESLDLDMDRYNGDERALYQYAGIDYPVGEVTRAEFDALVADVAAIKAAPVKDHTHDGGPVKRD